METIFVLRWEGNTDYQSGVEGAFRSRESAEKAKRALEDDGMSGRAGYYELPHGREDDWPAEAMDDKGVSPDRRDGAWTIDYLIDEVQLVG